MKIGVLTYHCVPNFGAQLQAISTIGYLKKLGHDAIILNWYAPDLEQMYSQRVPKEQIEKHLLFMEESMPHTEKCQTEQELVHVVEKYGLEAIIVGSDALFKYTPVCRYRHFSIRKLKYIYHYRPLSCEQIEENPFFGEFLGTLKKRIPATVYAASSQNCPFSAMNWIEKRKMKQALNNYRFISVRDLWTSKMIRQITSKNEVPVFPDPVFSFNQNCPFPIPSKEEILNRYNLEPNYVLFSFSDWHVETEYVQSIVEEIKVAGYQPVALPMPEKLVDFNIEKKVSLPLSPIDWYALIIHSSGYIGERMHPIIVCLHNAIPFFCFDEYGMKETICDGPRKEIRYNPLSSKTYQIVSDAGLLNQLFSYKGKDAKPSAQDVRTRLLSFDSDRCKEFSREKLQAYMVGMNTVISSLK